LQGRDHFHEDTVDYQVTNMYLSYGLMARFPSYYVTYITTYRYDCVLRSNKSLIWWQILQQAWWRVFCYMLVMNVKRYIKPITQHWIFLEISGSGRYNK